jgi:hypothetical protein
MIRGGEGGLLGFFRSSASEAIETPLASARASSTRLQEPAAPAIYYGVRITLAIGLPASRGCCPRLGTGDGAPDRAARAADDARLHRSSFYLTIA